MRGRTVALSMPGCTIHAVAPGSRRHPAERRLKTSCTQRSAGGVRTFHEWRSGLRFAWSRGDSHPGSRLPTTDHGRRPGRRVAHDGEPDRPLAGREWRARDATTLAARPGDERRRSARRGHRSPGRALDSRHLRGFRGFRRRDAERPDHVERRPVPSVSRVMRRGSGTGRGRHWTLVSCEASLR